jgi:site-specific recombinase XerD
MNGSHPIAGFVQGFFHEYLAAQRGLSPNTILSYRDALKLLLCYVSRRVSKPVDKLLVEDIDETVVVAFLQHLESDRGNAPQTRNNRLSTLRTFFRYVASQEPTLVGQCQRICTIPNKRTEHKEMEYLEDQEIGALLDHVDQNARNGARDYALFLFLYNTGARAQEVVDLKVDDLRLDVPSQVKLTGKGRKERVCPLWPETVVALRTYLEHREPDSARIPFVFLNANGQPITRFGIRYIVRRYADKAAEVCPSLKSKKISPHSVRHTTAMHLLQSGNDLSVIKNWMGHADVNTTNAYVKIDMNMKRKALEASQAPDTNTSKKKRPKWLEPSVLKWLDDLSKCAKIMCSPATVPLSQPVSRAEHRSDMNASLHMTRRST